MKAIGAQSDYQECGDESYNKFIASGDSMFSAYVQNCD
jgi:hypothetical protein